MVHVSRARAQEENPLGLLVCISQVYVHRLGHRRRTPNSPLVLRASAPKRRSAHSARSAPRRYARKAASGQAQAARDRATVQHLGARVLCSVYRPAISRRPCPAAHDIQRNAESKTKAGRSSCGLTAAALATAATLAIVAAAVIAAAATAAATDIEPLGKKRGISVSQRAGCLFQLAAERSAGTILRLGG